MKQYVKSELASNCDEILTNAAQDPIYMADDGGPTQVVMSSGRQEALLKIAPTQIAFFF